MADLQAMAARHRLAEARRAEAETRGELGRLEARRAAALGTGPAADTLSAQATAAFLRWTERERRRLLTRQAARRAEAQTIRQENARILARHAVLARLLQIESGNRR